ncbi:unnamed protein product [Larinioides sclopetarius]|uniref:Uncharacterized protein n=1 Tax=Larinioides sclopetarius TaxID=280406 RepID=A0AAV2A4M7_9ARAC
MASVKISSISTFTIFLTLLLLSSTIYCQGGEYDDCKEDGGSGSGPGPGNGPGPGHGPGPGPGKPGPGPGGNQFPLNLFEDMDEFLSKALDPAFFKNLFDSFNQVNGILNQIMCTLIDAADGGQSDTVSKLTDLFSQLSQPLSNLLDTLANTIASLGTAAINIVFDVLPPQLSVLRDPVETAVNYFYDVVYGLKDAFEGVLNGSGDSALKGLGDASSGAEGLLQSLVNLPDTIQSLLNGGA